MTDLDLFGEVVQATPRTEGIKYAGSKRKLLPQILRMVQRTGAKSVLDGFAGTTRVSQALAQTGHQVTCNDVSAWSRTFGRCYLLSIHPRSHYSELIDHLNALPGKEGWFTEHYGGETRPDDHEGNSEPKRPWQRHNTLKLDAVREEIERLCLDEVEKAVALTSLILALDEVDSTLGHFASYLREWSPRSYKSMRLTVPNIVPAQRQHAVHQRDIFDLIDETEVDLAYFDPPYGSNNERMPPSRIRYAAYYHLWTSICLFDAPVLFGKVNRRADSSDAVAPSVFEDFRRDNSGRFVVVEAIDRLIKRTRARHILLSYSSGGRATAEELHSVIEGNGTLVEAVEVDHKRHVMTTMRWTHEWVSDTATPNKEFLFLIEK